MGSSVSNLNRAAAEQWRQQGNFLSIDGQEIFIVESVNSTGNDTNVNSKPALVLVHGFPTSSFDWLPMWATLEQHFHLLTLDMLGFGFSDKPEGRQHYSIHRQADFVEALVKQRLVKKGIEQYHLLVHDYGVSVGQELLARDAEQSAKHGVQTILSCCFLNGGLFPEMHRALLIQKLLLSPVGRLVNGLSSFKSFAKSFSKVFGDNSKPSQAELEAFWQVINTNGGKRVFHNCITYMNDRIEHRERWVGILQTSKVPLALINGSVDPVSGSHLVAHYQQQQCRLDYVKQLPTIGHYPQVEDPTAVSNAYLEFVDGLNALPVSK